MKKANRIVALLMAMVLVLGLAVTASAEETTYSITVVNANPGHVYEAYQIFTGTLTDEANPDDDSITDNGNVAAKLSNVAFADGVSYNGAGVVVGKDEHGDDIISKQAMDLAYALEKGTLSIDTLLADLTLGGVDAISGDQTDGKYVISGLTPGYYLVKDKANSLNGKYDAYTDYIVEVVENSIVKPKSSVPSVTKNVKDTNDTTGETSGWQDSADYDIGDQVPFQIVATLASNVADFVGPYRLIFNDTMQAGLTYNHDLTIKVGERTVFTEGAETGNMEGISVTYEGTALTITIADGKSFGNNAVLTLDYTATLNENATHYINGNTNSVKLNYANDPNWQPPTDGTTPPPPTGDTPESVVIVYTYKLIVDKVDPEGNAVEDAGFTLYKKDANGTFNAVVLGTDAAGKPITEMKGEQLTTFVWSGLDDGTYKLVETTVPAGYNKAADLEFTITADHDLNGTTHVLDLNGGNDLVLEENQEDPNYGALTTDIVNRPGAVLPETGGMGTTLFYAIGGVLVLAAIVLLVSKKRMASAE